MTTAKKQKKEQFVKEQVELYFNTLHCHGQKGGRFCYFPENQKQLLFSDNFQNSIKNISDMLIKYPNNSVFVSLNSYHLKKDAVLSDKLSLRNSNNLWGIDCFMIDIDVDGYAFGQEDALIEALSWQWGKKGFLPAPNLISKTGSGGLHLYWAFARLPKNMKKSVNLLKYKMAERFIELEKFGAFPVAYDENDKECHYHVDLKVLDTQRMDRIPGSINPKNGNMCTCSATGVPRYTYSQLKDFLLEDKKYRYNNELRDTKNSISELRGSTLINKNNKFNNKQEKNEERERILNKKRIDKLFKIAESGKDFYGCRENACFLLYNFSVMAGDSQEKTHQLIDRLNGCFYSPLSTREAHAVYSGKVYHFTNAKIAECLDLTPEEASLMFPSHKRPGNRKARTKKDKIDISKLILEGYAQGEIAKKLNVSLSVVKRRRAEMKKDKTLLFFANGARKGRVSKVVKKYIEAQIEKIRTRKNKAEKGRNAFCFAVGGSFCAVLYFSIDLLACLRLVSNTEIIQDVRGGDDPSSSLRPKWDNCNGRMSCFQT